MGVQKDVVSWRDAPTADFAVLGQPIAHSLSPAMHMAGYSALGIELNYVALEVPPADLLQALEHLAALGYEGVNLTVPHKQIVLPWLKEADHWVHRIGACNTIKLDLKIGINTDAPGFAATLSDLKLEGSRCLLLGAGGSASAVVEVLKDQGALVAVWTRRFEMALEFAGKHNIEAVERADPSGCALILNATPSSLIGETMPILWANAEPEATAYDLAYGKNLRFLEDSKPYLLRQVDGRQMLVEQGALAMEWWLGIEAPHKEMQRAVEAQL